MMFSVLSSAPPPPIFLTSFLGKLLPYQGEMAPQTPNLHNPYSFVSQRKVSPYLSSKCSQVLVKIPVDLSWFGPYLNQLQGAGGPLIRLIVQLRLRGGGTTRLSRQGDGELPWKEAEMVP